VRWEGLLVVQQRLRFMVNLLIIFPLCKVDIYKSRHDLNSLAKSYFCEVASPHFGCSMEMFLAKGKWLSPNVRWFSFWFLCQKIVIKKL